MHRYFAQMHDDERRAESLGEVDCLKSLFDRAFAFLAVRRREPVAIGRSVQHLDRQWTEIVQAGKFHFARLEHFLNSWHERDANAVAELNAIEAKIDNLAQHFCAVGMPA